MPQNILNVFSSGYFITTEEIDVIEWGGDYAVMSTSLYDKLSVEGTPVVVKTGQRHIHPKSEGAVPGMTLAVPDKQDRDVSRNLLVARPGHAEKMLGQ